MTLAHPKPAKRGPKPKSPCAVNTISARIHIA